MSGARRWSAEDFARVRALAFEKLAREPLPPSAPSLPPEAPSPPPTYGSAMRNAAVLSRFRLDDLEGSAEDLALLRTSSVAVGDPAGGGWRTLLADTRSAVFRQVQPTELAALVTAHAREDDPLQAALRAVLAGGSREDLARLEPGSLAALIQVHDGLAGSVPDLPARGALERDLELARLLDPLRRLTHTFSGREAELQRLRDFVGVLPPGSLLGAAKRLVESTFRASRRLPFLVYGAGGVGKTSLIAQFILDHAVVGEERQFPFAYLDFDRPTLMGEEPATLLVEAVRQIGLQYSVAAEAAESLRQRWASRLRAFTKGSLAEAFAGDFASFLGTLGVEEGPVLLVLDTFEEVQLRSSSQARAVARLAVLLSERIPRLRVVIAGRVEIPDTKMGDTLHLTEFDPASAVGFLRGNGVDAATAETMARQVGGSPLTLGLALALYRADPEGVRARGLGVDGTALAEGVIQAQLFDRILRHIKDEDVRRLAHPGLVLRRVTRELIQEVLAGPCGIAVPDAARADELFEKLRRDVTLFNSTDQDRTLVHRPDVRRLMLRPLRTSQPRKVADIHRGAVAFYARAGDLVSRAEEVYHRLSLGQGRDEVGPIGRELEPFLAGAIEELLPPEQAVLAEAFGRELSPEAAAAADQETWERLAVRQVNEALQVGDLSLAGKVLAQRTARSAETELRVSEVRYLTANGERERAAAAVREGLAAYRSAGNAPALFALLLLAAEVAEEGDPATGERPAIGSPTAAAALDPERLLDEASELARRREDPFLQMRALRAQCALARRAGEQAPEERRRELATLAAGTPDTDWGQDPSLLRGVVAEVGNLDPELVVRAAGLGTIELSTSHLWAIALQLGVGEEGAQLSLADILRSPRIDRDSAAWPAAIDTIVGALRLEERDRPAPPSAPRPRRSRLRLDTGARAQLRDLLGQRSTHDLAAFVERRLGRGVEAISFAADPATMAADLIAAADREGWLLELLVALGRSGFDQPDVLRFLDGHGLAPVLVEAAGRLALPRKQLAALVATRRGRLGAVAARTCTVEEGGEVRGSGFLVAPDLVLTAGWVVAQAPRPRGLVCRFDQVTLRGDVVDEGNPCTLSRRRPIAEQADLYALLRIDTKLGNQPVDAGRAEPGAKHRGFVGRGEQRASPLSALLWLWRERRGTFVSGVASPSREREPREEAYRSIPASPRVAGAPCLDSDLEVVGVLGGQHPDEPPRLVPFAAIGAGRRTAD